jgi:hypothetical protein
MGVIVIALIAFVLIPLGSVFGGVDSRSLNTKNWP